MIAILLLTFGVDYNVIAIRSPNPEGHERFPEVANSVVHPPSDIVSIPVSVNDGKLTVAGEETVIVAGNGDSLYDPVMSLDGEWLYFVRMPKDDQKHGRYFWPRAGTNIWRVKLSDPTVAVRVTDTTQTGLEVIAPTLQGYTDVWPDREWTPGYHRGDDYQYPDHYLLGEVCNLGPCPLPGGRMAFVSSRAPYQTQRGSNQPHTELFILDDIPGQTDWDGEEKRNAEKTGYLNLGGALHPVLMKDGQILWSSLESQGRRSGRLWCIWTSYPDGRNWGPFFSAFTDQFAYHFHGQLTNGDVYSTLYYNAKQLGFGAIFAAPLSIGTSGGPLYHSDIPDDNPPHVAGGYVLRDGGKTARRFSTTRKGLYAMTPFTHYFDSEAAIRTTHEDGTRTYEPVGKVSHPSSAPENDLLVCYSPGVSSLTGFLGDEFSVKERIESYNLQIGLIVDNEMGKPIAETPDDIQIIAAHPDYHYSQPIAGTPWTGRYDSIPPEIPVDPNPESLVTGVVGSPSAHIGQWIQRGRTTSSIFKGWSMGNSDARPGAIAIVAQTPLLQETRPSIMDKPHWSNAANERLQIMAIHHFDEPDRPDGDTSFAFEIPANMSWTFALFDENDFLMTIAQTWHQLKPGEVRLNCGGCHNHSGEAISWDFSYFADKEPISYKPNPVALEYYEHVKPILEKHCYECHSDPDNPTGIVLDDELATSDLVEPLKAFESRLVRAIEHMEGVTPMPFDQPKLSDDEILAIKRWVDLGLLKANIPGSIYMKDLVFPTLYVPRSGRLKVGAVDLNGLEGPPTVTINGELATLTDVGDHVWDTGYDLQIGDEVIAEVKDSYGNLTKVERYIREATDEPDDDLEEQLRKLIAENDKLKAVIEDWRRRFDGIKELLPE